MAIIEEPLVQKKAHVPPVGSFVAVLEPVTRKQLHVTETEFPVQELAFVAVAALPVQDDAVAALPVQELAFVAVAAFPVQEEAVAAFPVQELALVAVVAVAAFPVQDAAVVAFVALPTVMAVLTQC